MPSKGDFLRKRFLEWVDEELSERGWTLRELDRRSPCVSASSISNIRHKRRNVTWDVVAGVAVAFDQRPEDGFRRVGLLPNHKTDAETLNEILSYLPKETVKEVLRYAEWKRKRSEK